MDSTSDIYCKSEKIRLQIGEDEFKSFIKLEMDESRVQFVYDLNLNFFEESDIGRKNLEKAVELKNAGNECFKQFEWKEAFQSYTESLIQMPSENTEAISILLGNRAAVLHHMLKYELCLQDIAGAIAAKYPEHLMYKVLQRQAKCYLALKKYDEALISFKQLVYSLVWAKMADGKLAKLELYVDDMIDYLTNRQRVYGKRHEEVAIDGQQFRPYITPALEYQCTDQAGRFAVAKTEIRIADPIIVEAPHASVLLPEFRKSHCHHCFKRVLLPLPCDNCCNIIYCSGKCKVKAQTYHKYECDSLSAIWRSKILATHQVALRMMTQKSLGYFLTLKEELEKNIEPNDWNNYANDDYRKVYGLVTHTSIRDAKNVWDRSVIAVFFLNLLENAQYFIDDDSDESKMYIGGLLLHNIFLLEMNDHEIGEYQEFENEPNGTSVVIGDGIYPSLALFNHSCDPGIVRYYRGNIVCANAIKNIKPGEMIAENYGPMYTNTKRDLRKKLLQERYNFNCLCQACIENWPLISNLDVSTVQLKCIGQPMCTKTIIVPVDIKAHLIRCSECGGATNVIKAIQALQDTEELYQMALNLRRQGKSKEALSKFIGMMNKLNEFLAPPSLGFNACQQGIRRYFLEIGSVILVPSKLN